MGTVHIRKLTREHRNITLPFAHWRQTSLFIATNSETHNLSKHMLARSAVRMVAANSTKRVVPVDIVRCARRCKPAFDLCLLSHANLFMMMHRVDPRFNLAPIANMHVDHLNISRDARRLTNFVLLRSDTVCPWCASLGFHHAHGRVHACNLSCAPTNARRLGGGRALLQPPILMCIHKICSCGRFDRCRRTSGASWASGAWRRPSSSSRPGQRARMWSSRWGSCQHSICHLTRVIGRNSNMRLSVRMDLGLNLS